MLMTLRVKNYFSQLERRTHAELDRSAEKLVREEKRSVALLIAHLSEMSRRKTALELGYKSLFEYCVKKLRLSEGSVARRLRVANLARRVPRILVALAENTISLKVAGLLAPHVRASNADKLISECAGLTSRAVEQCLVAIEPRPLFRPSIRKQPARPTKPDPTAATAPERSAESHGAPNARPPTPPIMQPARPDTFNFRFSAGKKFKEKLERFAEVMGVEDPVQHQAVLLEAAVDLALLKKDPKKKLERRQKRESGRKTTESRARGGAVSAKVAKAPSRYVASAVRERVFARADYQCEYRSRDGTRCSSRTGLELEHTRPFGVSPTHDEKLLKAFCRAHNRLAADRFYGDDFMKAKVAAGPSRSG